MVKCFTRGPQFPQRLSDNTTILVTYVKWLFLSLQLTSSDIDGFHSFLSKVCLGTAAPFSWCPLEDEDALAGEPACETGVCVHLNESVPDSRRFSSGEGREGKL